MSKRNTENRIKIKKAKKHTKYYYERKWKKRNAHARDLLTSDGWRVET
jgi:hypothetical protein